MDGPHIIEKTGLDEYINAADGQRIAEFASELLDELRFDGDSLANAYFPKSGHKLVSLKPGRRRGEPVIDRTGTPTTVLYSLYLAEGGAEDVADYYELELSEVQSAVDFEQSLLDAS